MPKCPTIFLIRFFRSLVCSICLEARKYSRESCRLRCASRHSSWNTPCRPTWHSEILVEGCCFATKLKGERITQGAFIQRGCVWLEYTPNSRQYLRAICGIPGRSGFSSHSAGCSGCPSWPYPASALRRLGCPLQAHATDVPTCDRSFTNLSCVSNLILLLISLIHKCRRR